MKPVIVAFEGIDGSGKGLQLSLLLERLTKENKKVKVMDFPQYDSFFGKEIGRFLSGKYEVSADKMDPKTMSLWYAMDRWMSFKNAEIDDCDIVLLNRSTLSNAVYQVMRAPDGEKDALTEWINTLEFGILEIPKVDMFIVFDVPVSNSRKNVAKKGHRDYVGNDSDVYEKDMSFLEKVRQGYLAASKKFENTVVIDCTNEEGEMRDRFVIADEVYQIVTDYCAGKSI